MPMEIEMGVLTVFLTVIAGVITYVLGQISLKLSSPSRT